MVAKSSDWNERFTPKCLSNLDGADPQDKNVSFQLVGLSRLPIGLLRPVANGKGVKSWWWLTGCPHQIRRWGARHIPR